MKKRLFSVLYMFLITLFFTSLVSAVKLLNEERIETNQRVKLQRIILKVLNIPLDDKAPDKSITEIFDNRIKSIQIKDRFLYVGYQKDGKSVLGYAFQVGGSGFWGPISGIVAVDPVGSKIIGIAFYEHSETPGLGARMTEKWFTDQFMGLRLQPPQGDRKSFYLRPEGTGKASNELDAITGATMTSRGIETFLNRDLNYFLKDIRESIMKLPAASYGVSKRNCAEANPPSLFELRRGSPRHSSLCPRSMSGDLRCASTS